VVVVAVDLEVGRNLRLVVSNMMAAVATAIGRMRPAVVVDLVAAKVPVVVAVDT
jgi:hypothetical protein